MIFGGQIRNPFVSVIVDLAIGSEGHSEGPPTGMRDFGAGNFMTILVRTNQQDGAVFFLARFLFEIQLDEEPWPVLFEGLGGF